MSAFLLHRSSRWVLVGLVALFVGLAVVWIWSGATLAGLTAWIAGLNGVLVFLFMAILPIGGFSVGVVYVVAGIKFGAVGGGFAVAAATAIHLVGTHWICRSMLRGPLLNGLLRRGHSLPVIPAGEDVSVAAMVALLPGPPYFIRNYMLGLSGIPLRTYFWVCLPIYLIRSYVAIVVGKVGVGLNAKSIGVLAAIYSVKLGVCAYLLWRIRRRIQRAENARTPEKMGADK
jgi:uncharacterized membrane protein YdjX (TVP38/TMEM64 family)